MRVEQRIRELIDIARRHGITASGLARAIEKDHSTLRAIGNRADFKMGRGTFNPTFETIDLIERFVTNLDPEAVSAIGTGAPPSGLGFAHPHKERVVGKLMESERISIPAELAPHFEPSLYNIEKYCERLRARHGSLSLAHVRFDVIRALSPASVCHIADAPKRLRDAKWQRWQPRADWRGGVDLTGQSVGARGDEAFMEEIVGDLLVAKETDFAHYHALSRTSTWEETGGQRVTRHLGRLLLGVESPNEGIKVMWITVPQKRGPLVDLFGHLGPV